MKCLQKLAGIKMGTVIIFITHQNYALCGSTALVIPLVMSTQERYSRSNLDNTTTTTATLTFIRDDVSAQAEECGVIQHKKWKAPGIGPVKVPYSIIQ